MSNEDITLDRRPLPQKPRWGWLAWEATVGYLSQRHSPDATLTLKIAPLEHVIGWSARLQWGLDATEVAEQHSLADALNGLWKAVAREHGSLFKEPAVAVRCPTLYDDDHWLDTPTYEIFSRLVHVTDTVFQGDWSIVIIYRPVEAADSRIQARLLAEKTTVHRGGRGPTLRDACRDLFQKTAPVYQAHRQRDDE